MDLDGKKIGFIGCGNMGRAILWAILMRGIVKSGNVAISDKSDSRRYSLRRYLLEAKFELCANQVFFNNKGIVKHADIIILAVKPHQIEDVLKATQYLFKTRDAIERIEGRIKYLENLTDLATIRVSLSEELRVEIPAGTWKPLTIIKKAFMAMLVFWQGIVNILIWLLIFLVPLGIIAWIIIKIIKKIKK